jgi:crotonobetainyl-CoA:carnitine CoA-transferase CaiB-like acyl-CoA transferase
VTDDLPLHGLRVLEISQGWATPLAGKLMVDLGASVLRLVADPAGADDVVVALGGAEAELARHLLDAGMVLIGPDQLDGLGELVARADVVLGDRELLDRLDVAAQAGPTTVVCVVSPFGSDGPLADHVASEVTLQAASAIMATTGEPGGDAMRAGTELGAAVGALYACIGSIAALLERHRSGLGQTVDVSLYDCLVSTLTQFASRVLGGVPPLKRLGNQGANSAPWNLFESGDGQYVFIIAGSDPTFTRLSQVMGRADLLEDPRYDNHIHRRENREEVTAIVAEWAAGLPAAEIVESLRDAGVPVSLVATPAQVLEDPHFVSRHLLGVSESGGRSWQVAGSPLAIGRDWQDGGPAAATLDDWLAGAPFSGEVAEERQRPLVGLRVIDVGTITAGPFCARLLGNLGAEVVKVEPPEGELGRHSPPLVDGESIYFHITNNGKLSVCLDLGTPEGQADLRRLAGTADVLVENLAPGSLTKRGLGAHDLIDLNPRLVYASVSGFGHEGAAGGQRAYDTVVQAAGGLMGVTGEPGGKPLKTGISSADVLGAVGGTAAVLAALYQRETSTGAGRRLDVAMYDVVAWSTQPWWPLVFLGEREVERVGTRHRAFAPYGVFDCKDGGVALSCETGAQWAALLGLLAAAGVDVPDDWAGLRPDGRVAQREQIEKVVQEWCLGLTRTEVTGAAQGAGVPAEPVLDCPEVVSAPHTVARGLVAQATRTGREPVRVTEFPVRLSATPAGVTTGAPGVDEHGAELRSTTPAEG